MQLFKSVCGTIRSWEKDLFFGLMNDNHSMLEKRQVCYLNGNVMCAQR